MEESHKVLFNGIFLPLLTVIMLMRSLRVFVRIFYLCILNCVRPRLVSHSSPAYTAKKKNKCMRTLHTLDTRIKLELHNFFAQCLLGLYFTYSRMYFLAFRHQHHERNQHNILLIRDYFI